MALASAGAAIGAAADLAVDGSLFLSLILSVAAAMVLVAGITVVEVWLARRRAGSN